MRIVDRATFLALPAGTLYAKYKPCCTDGLCIKGENCGKNDWFYQDLSLPLKCHGSGEWADRLLTAQETGESVALDLQSEGRDGCFEADQLFAVWEPDDVAQLIARLKPEGK